MNKSVLTLFFSLCLIGIVACKKDKPAAETVTDIDGNVYKTVKIGTQTWMAENLKTTKFKDGTAIPEVQGNAAWSGLQTPGYCWYDNDKASNEKYGALYNGYVVVTGKLAPTGWHVATDQDWQTLTNYLINNGYNYDGAVIGNKIAKSLASTSEWESKNTVGGPGNDIKSNNKSNFNALPPGVRYGSDGTFNNVTRWAYWWTSTSIDPLDPTHLIDYRLRSNYSDLAQELGGSYIRDAYSVRCVKD
jgi:uncharacterized protein (TIGR02145 family)